MEFFDCNAFIGLPARREIYPPAPTAETILAEMDFCGVERALVWHIAQFDAAPQLGNHLLAQAIRPHDRLTGCWSVLPNPAREFPPFDQFLSAMRQARVAVLRAFPLDHHFLLNRIAMESWLEPMVAHRVPLFLSVARGADWDILYALLAEFPDLVCVVCDHGCWGEDRRFRPLIECYPHVYVDTSQYLLDGGIEAFVQDYGPDRMLYGSGFPISHFGGMMLALRHAKISEDAKAAIAAKNLERLLAEVIW
jgi:predicted TIM-barrel fold metal-dependent hydrolase